MGGSIVWAGNFEKWHWNGNVILTKFSSLAAPDIVKMTMSGAASVKNFIKIMIIPLEFVYIIFDMGNLNCLFKDVFPQITKMYE